MKIAASDELLIWFCQKAPGLLKWLGNRETRSYASELASIRVARPVYVCSLARSGSTLLLELLSSLEGMATHRYRDFPFLSIPCWWSHFLDRFPKTEAPVERPHKDRITITSQSPESMEEPLWTTWFPNLHAPNGIHRLSSDLSSPRFEKFYDEHLRKILMIRKGVRYLSKNNYHVGRLEYLAKLYPDAEFVVPIRDPFTHIESLARQHRLFCEYSLDEPRIPRYLAAAGHFEFGPQRVPFRLTEIDGDRIQSCWDQGDDLGGYAIQWKSVYGLVRESLKMESLRDRIHVVRYEDFCRLPNESFRWLLHRIDFDSRQRPSSALMDSVSLSQASNGLTQAQRDRVWTEVGEVAASFGYSHRSLRVES